MLTVGNDGDRHYPMPLGANSTFLGYLTSKPDGDSLARALCLGPLAPLRPVAALHLGTDNARTYLEPLGAFGVDGHLNGQRRIPLTWEVPPVQAFMSGQHVTNGHADIRARYPVLTPWLDGHEQRHPGRADSVATVVSTPVIYDGVAVGVSVVFIADFTTLNDHQYEHLNGASSALSLWQELRRFDQQHRVLNSPAAHSSDGAGLSARQLDIIELIRQGRGNDGIARDLGFSVGTIKAEIQVMFTKLAASSRVEIVTNADLLGVSRGAQTTSALDTHEH